MAVNGVATFPNLSINNAGTGYTLVAVSPGLTGATSLPFDITSSTAQSFVVTTTNDSGSGSLRQAILNANANAEIMDTIVFDIPGAAPHTIAPTSALPGINDPVRIDAAPPGACSGIAPSIEIDGVSAGLAHGLFVATGGTIIRGLSVTRFASSEYAGIFFAGGGGGVVECSYLGLAPDGVTVKGNSDGLRIGGSFNNTIGGRADAARNVISGNLRNGVLIMGPTGVPGSVMQNLVQGNFIGTDASGTLDRGNGANGVHIVNSSSNTIGGSPEGRNVIAGNTGEGVRIDGATATANHVEGNYIGTTVSGSTALGNSASGVYIRRAPGNFIARNLVSSNEGFAGIAICGNATVCGGGDVGAQGNNASGNVIEGNLIGTNAEGSSDLGNFERGVSIDGAPNTLVGGTTAAARNVISANIYGVEIINPGATGNQISGNFIGTNSAGTAPMGNRFFGVAITDVSNNLVGGTAAGAGNLISTNGTDVLINGSSATGNLVQGNYIGLNAAGTAALGESGGVRILGGASSNTIGGTTASARNVLSGNSVGVQVSSGQGNTIQGNYIGLNAAGTEAVPNTFRGIEFDAGASSNTVGGTSPGAGNVISGNANGIGMFGSTGNLVQGNLIGLNPAGTAALPNNFVGVLLLDSPSNTIGGTTVAARNIISGNRAQGVLIADPGASGNIVEGNYVGLNAAGTATLGNGGDGILILNGPSNNVVGGTAPGAGNVISGNQYGMSITGAGTTGNVVQGNFMGTNPAGTAALGNLTHAININTNASGNIVGGSAPGARNVISGNQAGILLLTGANGNLLEGNFIGTNAAGTGAIANGNGIYIDGAPSNIIGGTATGSGNVLSGNTFSGITINNPTASGNAIQGNLIGTNQAGNAAVPNVTGIFIQNASGNTIGGTAPGSRNTISGNVASGVIIVGEASSGNLVQGNFIGTDLVGTAAVPNGGSGVFVATASSNNTLGGAMAGARNVISGNTFSGVDIRGNNNAILGNFIGTSADGNAAIGNNDGVFLADSATGNIVGDAAANAGNVISGNRLSGVKIMALSPGTGARQTLVQGNRIGTNAAGTAALANATGVMIENAPTNTIGGAASNLISGNTGAGVYITGALSTGNVVIANRIGTDTNGTGPVPNLGDGILIADAAGNTIGADPASGGGPPSSGNAIRNNGGTGVRVTGQSSTGNSILANSIFANGFLGIDLEPGGPTPNDSGDGDTGPNGLQNFPTITLATTTRIEGTLNSTPNTTFSIQYFVSNACDASGFGEGQSLRGGQQVTTDDSGNASFSLDAGATAGQYVTATATDPNGNTSEFSNCVPVGADFLFDTGPGGTTDGFLLGFTSDSFGNVYSQNFAGQFTLSATTTLESIQGWMDGLGSLAVVIRADEGGLPGPIRYSKTYVVPLTSISWITFSDYRPTLGAGTYWLSFEGVDPGPAGFQGGMYSGAPRPLARYAYGFNQIAGPDPFPASWIGSPLGLGMRISSRRSNGKIAFQGPGGITTISSDGTNPTVLTDTSSVGGSTPDWSPDGTKIVFSGVPVGSPTGFQQIFVINPDGTGMQQLTSTDSYNDSFPKWSPDGTKILFVRGLGENIFVMNADGTGVTALTASGQPVPGYPTYYLLQVDGPNWSRDSTKVVLTAYLITPLGRAYNLWILNLSSGEWRQLTPTDLATISFGAGYPDSYPSWSPDGAKIVFDRLEPDLIPPGGSLHHIYTINADGSGMSPRLTSAADQDYFATWSPDGSKILFFHTPRILNTQFGNPDLYIMNPDGTGLTPVTNDSWGEGLASWQSSSN
jgi:hypothetical protein